MLKLYNSLSREVEDFVAMQPPVVGMYSCGPTVYNFAHIGNFRAYLTADILVRVLKYTGFEVEFVMNITDVGHLTSDADSGEDKLEKSAKREGKTAWEVADFYTNVFLQDYEKLQLTPPSILAKATDHIKEQIALIRTLEEKGYTYVTADGVYFDTSMFPEYGQISTLDQIKEGARVEVNPEKRNARDFALWKFSPSPVGLERRQMEWWFEGPFVGKLAKESNWNKVDAKFRETIGFPGWHIECSAMSMKYLGNHFDIHTGGVDHLSVHHPDEIAQSEAATGEKFVNYWVHTAFMLVQGQKMSKSLENTYRLYDLEKLGYDPIALRYLYLQTHYRQEMNFTFPALDGAQNALKKLRLEIAKWDSPTPQGDTVISTTEKSRGGMEVVRTGSLTGVRDDREGGLAQSGGGVKEFEDKFFEAVSEDLNTPRALSVMWELVKSDYPTSKKATSLFLMDSVLGLNLREGSLALAREVHIVPVEVQALVKEREHLRKNRRFNEADFVRAKIEKLGYVIEDSKKGPRARKK